VTAMLHPATVRRVACEEAGVRIMTLGSRDDALNTSTAAPILED
jgi:hypothetical protein